LSTDRTWSLRANERRRSPLPPGESAGYSAPELRVTGTSAISGKYRPR
jgi:hypothetical protein